MTQWQRCSRPHLSAPSPVSATASSPAKAACPTASMRASTAGRAPMTRPPRWRRTARAWRRRSGGSPIACSPPTRSIRPPWWRSTGPGGPTRGPPPMRSLPPWPGLAMGVPTAVCGPVLFADETAGVIGVAHAGWRGAATGVLEATIAAMERCGADRARVAVALGPTIRQPNYEVGPEFVARFKAEDGANERFFRPPATPQPALFDLPGYIPDRLAAAGVRRVEDLGHCTYADATRFFSYRRCTHRNEPDYGRHINAIALAH